jgi:hypothetical protein
MAWKALQEQLIKAREAVQHQIDVLRLPIRGGNAKSLIATLEEELRDLDKALSNLKKDDE